MKTIYTSASKDAIATGQITLQGDKYMKVILTNEPDVIDTNVCTTDEIAPNTLLILHSTYCTWTTDRDWLKKHPKSGSGDQPTGYHCSHCHEPVYSYVSAHEDTGQLRHVVF
jgi:hypothetical protein